MPGVDDAAEFQATVNAMNIMGMTNEDYSGVMILFCLLLLLNYSEFKTVCNL